MLQANVKILYNKKVKNGYFHMRLLSSGIAKQALPGQFLNIKVNESCEPLLRRPLSIHKVGGNNIEIFYAVVGEATKILSQRKPGEFLSVIGPLGNGFDCKAGKSKVLVAGGMGVAPLVFLAKKLTKSIAKNKPLVLIGAKTKNDILCEKEFKDLGCAVKIATDDGSKGFKGYVSELLSITLSTIDYRPSTIYACGPKHMLKEIVRLCNKHSIPAQVSLEEHMACGIGACLGCVVNTKKGFKRVCKEGPVFNGDELTL
jgi:dihydroorotate dehydrogenase electron transfer subunit